MRTGVGFSNLEQLAGELKNLVANQVGEPCQATILQGEFDAAHDVGAVLGLGVEGGSHGQHVTGLEVQELRHQGSRAEVHGDPKAFAWGERKGGIVGEDGSFPLRQINGQVGGGLGPASQAPAVAQLSLRKAAGIFIRHW